MSHQRSNSDRWSTVKGGAAGRGADPPACGCGKNAIAEPAPPRNSIAITSASGLATSTRMSHSARPGSLAMGTELAPPARTNTPITATYVVTHSGQTSFRMNTDE